MVSQEIMKTAVFSIKASTLQCTNKKIKQVLGMMWGYPIQGIFEDTVNLQDLVVQNLNRVLWLIP